MASRFSVREVSWQTASSRLAEIRHQVFVIEQNVPIELELDGLDASARHVQATAADDEVIGTGRLLPDGHIGRVAVLREWRGSGVGQALMASLIRLASESGQDEVTLHAQTSALRFYELLGFVAHGETFMDAGIPHRAMTLKLD